jgi:hypothetical protein
VSVLTPVLGRLFFANTAPLALARAYIEAERADLPAWP